MHVEDILFDCCGIPGSKPRLALVSQEHRDEIPSVSVLKSVERVVISVECFWYVPEVRCMEGTADVVDTVALGVSGQQKQHKDLTVIKADHRAFLKEFNGKAAFAYINDEFGFIPECTGEFLAKMAEIVVSRRLRFVVIPAPSQAHGLAKEQIEQFVQKISATGCQVYMASNHIKGDRVVDSGTLGRNFPKGIPVLPQIVPSLLSRK